MNLNDVQKEIDKLEGSKEAKESIAKLIDIKTTNDMKEIIAEMKSFKNEINTSIGALNSKLDTSIGALNSKLDTSIGALNGKIDNIKWFIASAAALAVASATNNQPSSFSLHFLLYST